MSAATRMILYPKSCKKSGPRGGHWGLRSLRRFVLRAALGAACAAAACGGATCGGTSPADRQIAQSRERADAAGLASQTAGAMPVVAAAPAQIATLDDRAVRESSGVVASRRNPGLFWTHNDSGDGPLVYAFDRAGRSRGAWRVAGAEARDWEDIAAGPGPAEGQSYLYAGDIGDNGREREFVVVYRFAEPQVGAAADGRRRETGPAEAIRLNHPDGAHNSEALLVHPRSGDLYVVTKTAQTAGVYKLAAPFNAAGVNTLTRVAALKGPDFFGALVTGGDISPDGRRVALCDYAQG